jgi:hypothetical protein
MADLGGGKLAIVIGVEEREELGDLLVPIDLEAVAGDAQMQANAIGSLGGKQHEIVRIVKRRRGRGGGQQRPRGEGEDREEQGCAHGSVPKKGTFLI